MFVLLRRVLPLVLSLLSCLLPTLAPADSGHLAPPADERGHRIESIMRLGGAGEAPEDLPVTVLVTTRGALHAKGDMVVITSFDGGPIRLLRPQEQEWEQADAPAADLVRGMSLGMLSGLAERAGAKEPDFSTLRATGATDETPLGEGRVHELKDAGLSIRVITVDMALPEETRRRLVLAEHENINTTSFVPASALLALPGYPARIEVRIVAHGDEMQFMHEVKSLEPFDVPGSAFLVPDGWRRAPGMFEEAPADPPPADVYEAAARGDVEAVRRFAQDGVSLVDPDAKRGMTPLHWAAEKDQVGAALALIALGAPVASRDTRGRTVLHAAAAAGSRFVAAALLGARADIDALDTSLNTPLTLAERGRHEDVAALLRDRGARASERTLAWAALNGDARRIEELLEAGADPSAIVHDGATPLLLAVRGGHDEAAEVLLASGARTDVQGADGLMPAHAAAMLGRVTVLDTLLRIGVPVDQRSAVGATPLHVASEAGQAGAVKLLLERGADAAAKDGSGRAAREVAVAAGHSQVLALLP